MVEQLLIHTSLTKKEAVELSVEMLERVGINEPGKRFFSTLLSFLEVCVSVL